MTALGKRQAERRFERASEHILRLMAASMLVLSVHPGHARAQSVDLLGLVSIDCKEPDASSSFGICSITSQADRTIAFVSFTLIVREQGRAVPWGSEPVRIWIAGGLEPAESTVETVAWPALPARAEGHDLQFLIEDVAALDPSGQNAILPRGESVPPPEQAGIADILRKNIGRCWNVGALSTSALEVALVVTVDIGRDGRPDAGSLRLASATGGDEGAARQAYEGARRAIIRCGASGLGLPGDQYEEWRTVDLIFAPHGGGISLVEPSSD